MNGKKIGDKIEGGNYVNYCGNEQCLFRRRYAGVLQHAAKQHDHVWQEHQKITHAALCGVLFLTGGLVFYLDDLGHSSFLLLLYLKSMNNADFVQVYRFMVVW